jgi:DNA-binding NarL/FixJ family response regulator
MSIAISSSLATTATTAVNTSSSTTAAAAPKPQPTTNDQADTVQLNVAQQVEQLYSHGQTVPQIASSLNLSAQAVDSYLNISNTSK